MRKLLFLLVGLFTFLSSSAWTVYYADTRDDGKKWDVVAVYGYGGAGQTLGEWPGSKMTFVEEYNGAKLYKLETSVAKPDNLIFNNNDNESQDADINSPNDGYVYTTQAREFYTSYEDFKTNYSGSVNIDADDWRVGAMDFNGNRANWDDARILSNYPEEWDPVTKVWKFECESLNRFKFYCNGSYYGTDTINLNESNNYTVSVALGTDKAANTELKKDSKVEKLIVEFNTVDHTLKITGVLSDTPVVTDYTKYQVRLKSKGTNWEYVTFAGTDADGKLVVRGFNIGEGDGFNLVISKDNGAHLDGYKMESIAVNESVKLNPGTGDTYDGKAWNLCGDNFKNKTFDFTFDFVNMTVTLTESVALEDVYVYFVNQNGWDAVNIYTYKNGAGENAKFPGVAMEKVAASDPIYGLIKESDRDKLYKAVVDVDSYEQVIFAKEGGTQTRNLDLIGYGVYYPEEELFPSAWYDSENNELLSFPNDKVPSRFNTIYIEDSTLYEYASKEGNVVTVDIKGSLEENGEKTLTPTGNDGTTALVPVEIAGHKYLRLRLPQRLFPDGCWMELRVYEGNDSKAAHCSASDHKDNYHWTCDDAHRIIHMPNVQFHNGFIYTRDSNVDGTNILDVATPVSMKIEEARDGSLKVNGEVVKEYELTKQIDGIFLTYEVENVDKDSEFKVVAEFETSAGDSKHYYSAAVSGTKLYPGNPEKMVYDAEGSYKIDTDLLPLTAEYDLQVVWFNSEIIATGAKTTPDFKPVGGASHFRIDGVADDDEEGVELVIGHHNGFGGANADHYNAVEVTMVPAKEYAGIVNGANKGAEVREFTSLEGEGTSSIRVQAYTAGIYNLNVRLTKDINDGPQKFRASTTVIPVRVRPTVESVGLAFNAVRYSYDKTDDKNLSISLGFGDNGDQEFPTYTDAQGDWTSENVHLSTKYANSGVKVYWKAVGGTSDDVNETPFFVAAQKSDLDLNDDEYAASTEGYTLFKGKRSAPNLKEIAENGQSLSFIVEQNGLHSAPQTVKVYKAGDVNAPTDVEAIETADDAEAVYFNLNGVRVDAESLAPGIYVVVKGEKTEKIIVR